MERTLHRKHGVPCNGAMEDQVVLCLRAMSPAAAIASTSYNQSPSPLSYVGRLPGIPSLWDNR
jgi:hypothetical protein